MPSPTSLSSRASSQPQTPRRGGIDGVTATKSGHPVDKLWTESSYPQLCPLPHPLKTGRCPQKYLSCPLDTHNDKGVIL